MGTYSFVDSVLSITGPGGNFLIGGDGAANDEEGFSTEMVEDKNTMTIGADGSVMHSLHAGQAGTIKVTVLKTSPINLMLQGMYNLQVSASALWGQNTLTGGNLSSGDRITAQYAAFKRQTPVKYGKEGGTNEWTFDVGYLTQILGQY